MPDTAIQALLTRLFNGTITTAEKEELALLVQALGDDALEEQVRPFWEPAKLGELLSPRQPDALLQAIVQEAAAQETAVVRPMKRQPWKTWAVAASVLGIMAIGSYWLMQHRQPADSGVSAVPVQPDIPAPNTNRARITLANGQYILLDSAANGQLAQQANMQLVKRANGQVVYEAAGGNSGTAPVYNTLTNPLGSQVINITLSDGSRVWLNAGSSLTYPVAFIGKERSVTISGEGYFEVAHDPAKPFQVRKGATTIQVLGTHFNVNAYDEEANLKVTLLEGSVRVGITGGQSGILHSGEQAVVDEQIKLVKGADLEAVMAWRNGRFLFEDAADITVVMRQIARWYDVTVSYQGRFSQHIGGSISRSANLQQVLHMLELTGAVHFKVEGKQIIVQP
jgi:transmembrane sensor